MEIPEYVREIMSRAEYEYDCCVNHEDYAVGYTIRICKATARTYAATLEKEVERLCKWVDKMAGVKTAFVLFVPKKTRYCDQYAIVTVFDPIMQKIERYMPCNLR